MKHLNPDCPVIEIGSGNCPRCNPEPERKPQFVTPEDYAKIPKFQIKRRGKKNKW